MGTDTYGFIRGGEGIEAGENKSRKFIFLFYYQKNPYDFVICIYLLDNKSMYVSVGFIGINHSFQYKI